MKKNLFVAIAVAGCIGCSSTPADIKAWFAPSAWKVMQDEKPAVNSPLKWDLAAARNEVEGCQLVLVASKPISDATISVSGFSDRKGRLEVSLFKVGYVPCRKEKILFPDPLIPLKGTLELQPGQAQPIWISARVPKSAAPGVYRGKIKARAGTWSQTFPITVRVWDFALPDSPACQTAFGVSYELAADFEGVKLDSAEGKTMSKRYYEYMLDHRSSPMLLPVDLMSQEAIPYFEDPRMTSYLIQVGKKSDDDLKALFRYLQDGGWFAKSYFYEVDEPTRKKSYDALIAYTDRLRRIEPRYRAVTPFWANPDWDEKLKATDVMLGRVNIWCPHYLYLDSFPGTREFLKSRRNAGETYWWYVCNNPRRSMNNVQIDMPALPHRILFWQQKREGIDGFLYWDINYWNRQYIRDPWENQDVLSDDLYGDGSLVYPGAKVGVPGPVGSLRMEVIRDGIEDFDALTLADKWLGVTASKSYVTRIARTLKDFEQDPARFEAVRRELGAALEAAAAEERNKI